MTIICAGTSTATYPQVTFFVTEVTFYALQDFSMILAKQICDLTETCFASKNFNLFCIRNIWGMNPTPTKEVTMYEIEEMPPNDPNRPYEHIGSDLLTIAIRLLNAGWDELTEDQLQKLEGMQDELNQRQTKWAQ